MLFCRFSFIPRTLRMTSTFLYQDQSSIEMVSYKLFYERDGKYPSFLLSTFLKLIFCTIFLLAQNTLGSIHMLNTEILAYAYFLYKLLVFTESCCTHTKIRMNERCHVRIYPTPMTQGQFLRRAKLVSIQFSCFSTGCFIKVKEISLPYYLPSPSYSLNSITTVLKQRWLWD